MRRDVWLVMQHSSEGDELLGVCADEEGARAAGRIGGSRSPARFTEGSDRAKAAGRAGGKATRGLAQMEGGNTHAAAAPRSMDFA